MGDDSPASRRASARLRSRPTPTPIPTPTPPAKTPTPRKRAKKKIAAAKADSSDDSGLSDDGDDDDNADKPAAAAAAQDESDLSSEPEDDDSDTDDSAGSDFDPSTPSQRARKRAAAASNGKTAKAAAAATPKTPTTPKSATRRGRKPKAVVDDDDAVDKDTADLPSLFKAPKAPARKRAAGPSAKAGPKGRGTKRSVVRLELDQMWEAVTTPRVAQSGLVDDWLREYHIDASAALLALVNLILRATGCPEQLNAAQFDDQDAVQDYLTELQQHFADMTSYPLIARTKAVRDEMTAVFLFFSTLIQRDDPVMWESDAAMLQSLVQWITPMSSSSLRPFRHTATALALHLVSCLCTVVANDDHPDQQAARDVVKELIDAVFTHRYRDVDPTIRRECLRALGQWMERAPNEFLEPLYQRYFGWLLNDMHTTVRLTALTTLATIYGNPTLAPGMRLFSERYKSRILEMSLRDLDPQVRLAGARVTAALYPMGLLDQEDVDAFLTLVFAVHSTDVQTVLADALADRTWVAFGQWLRTTLDRAYGEAASNVQVDHALAHFVAFYTVPVLANHADLIALLRQTDDPVPNEMLLVQVLQALCEKPKTGPAVAELVMAALPALFTKYKGQDRALVALAHMVRAVPATSWVESSAKTATLGTVLTHVREALFRTADHDTLAELVKVFADHANRPELELAVNPHLQPLLDACAAAADGDHAAQTAAVMKHFHVDVDRANLGDSYDGLVAHFLACLREGVADPDLVEKCTRTLSDDGVSRTTKVEAVNLLAEYLAATRTQLNDDLAALMEPVLVATLETWERHESRNAQARAAATAQSSSQADVTMAEAADSEEDLVSVKSAMDLVKQWTMLLHASLLDLDYAASLLQFHHAITAAAPSDAAADPAAPHSPVPFGNYVDAACEFIVSTVFAEVPEARLNELTLAALQKQFQRHEGAADGGAVIPPTAVSLAKPFAALYKARRTVRVAPVVQFGGDWVVDEYEPAAPAAAAPVGTQEKVEEGEDEPAPPTGAAIDPEVLARANAAAAPMVRALRDLVPSCTVTDARALYARFAGKHVLHTLVVALAGKANIKHDATTAAMSKPKTPRRKSAAGTKGTTPARRRSTAGTGTRRTSKSKRLAESSDEDDGEEAEEIEDADDEDVSAARQAAAGTAVPGAAILTPRARRGTKRAAPDDEDVDAEVAAVARRRSTRLAATPAANQVGVAHAEHAEEEEGAEQVEGEGEGVVEEEEFAPTPTNIKRRRLL
ncbi:hypothetical protein AMAG_07271 [Allomyces macrogynus ATCC 38327]|uniref:SCD domain-containing protein n=1 Tax=Allomyces macrogynus (strain ATCC 38327) TaxID=578462 RepID=A0A0L0SHN5_ALLM3|nr:hypothetical protein AMAG_07271 [Allomyces macrogynus ATCC 38327]|eukprot:KNE62011.1 hypothetical protein AMAG_07271 [Allomyces macrogynus ATCC 38327]